MGILGGNVGSNLSEMTLGSPQSGNMETNGKQARRKTVHARFSTKPNERGILDRVLSRLSTETTLNLQASEL